MAKTETLFERVYKLTHEDGQREFLSILTSNTDSSGTSKNFELLKLFLGKIFSEINALALYIENDNTILISVKNQKTLQTCFQLVTSLGISSSLIPGVGISLAKRCISAMVLPPQNFTDQHKYELLTECTDFFTRCYEIPVLKNIILTFHLSDYLAALIQLSFAPLKKPGTYNNFIMTQELHAKICNDKKKYECIYKHLVANSFQPTLMKELLVLQSVSDPCPPTFVKRIISKEMSQRLLATDGLLSLIRCFIESYTIDTGFEWKKIDMICKIVTVQHGSDPMESYLSNICTQLQKILTSNNTHYLATAVACVLSLYEKYPSDNTVRQLTNDVFSCMDHDKLASKCLPGTVLLSPQEIEQNVNILHACVSTKQEWPQILMLPNLYLLFLLGVKCTKNEDMKMKLTDIVLKCLEHLSCDEVFTTLEVFLFGKKLPKKEDSYISVEEFHAGLAFISTLDQTEYPTDDAVLYIFNLFNSSLINKLVENMFVAALHLLIILKNKRQELRKNELLYSKDDSISPITEVDVQYGVVLQLLTEISSSPKSVSILKSNPSIVLPFIENFLIKSPTGSYDECVTISLILLNTILSNSSNMKNIESKLNDLIPLLKEMSQDECNLNSILCKEALSLLSSDKSNVAETPCAKAISDIFDDLLPVRTHGIIELTKLIDSKDLETMCKKHYIFCLFQEQLKDADSYSYLAAINGIAALGTHCTEDVLQVLCKEFLQISSEQNPIAQKEDQNKASELRMKVGDIILRVTRNLGEMAIKYKALLLNTVLCGCRDEDPLIRTSALSNLAEIALVLHYKIGTIIYEVLLCIWSIIESDKAVECRRAAVMVITSLLKGLGKETLVQLKENLLPVYRTLKKLYSDPDEDSVVRLHAQLALEELNSTVSEFLFPDLKMERQIFVLDKPEFQ